MRHSPIRASGDETMSDEQSTRKIISRLMREAVSILTEGNATDLAPALPKMRAAVMLAEQLNDKAPLLICQANLAWMSAICARPYEAANHIERAIDVAMDGDVATPVRNFAFMKFVEICVLLQRDHERATTYARALLQSAVDEEGNYHQFLATTLNLGVVCNDLLRASDQAAAVFSWLADEARPAEHPIAEQARKAYERIVARVPADVRASWVSDVEANRDALVEMATDGFLPRYALAPGSAQAADGEPR